MRELNYYDKTTYQPGALRKVKVIFATPLPPFEINDNVLCRR